MPDKRQHTLLPPLLKIGLPGTKQKGGLLIVFRCVFGRLIADNFVKKEESRTPSAYIPWHPLAASSSLSNLSEVRTYCNIMLFSRESADGF
jgi:hypothetical protein